MDSIRNSDSSQFLIGVFRTGSEAECSAAADRLVSLPVTKYGHLLSVLTDRNENVRRWSAISIGRMQEAFFAPQLVDLLKDAAAAVRETAFHVLRDLVGEDQVVELISAEKSRTRSTEAGSRLDSYLARARTEYRMAGAGLNGTERATLAADSHALIIQLKQIRRRGPKGRKAQAPIPAPLRRAPAN